MHPVIDSRAGAPKTRGAMTLPEIRQQPDIWPTTLERTASLPFLKELKGRAAIICGAGSSAYAASSVARAWSDARAIPTTDLLVQSKEELTRICPGFAKYGALVSLARSGESPESVGVVKRFRKLFPEAMQLAITCNKDGQLARMQGVKSIVLDPRAHDHSLVMTGSFSNLVLAGLAVQHRKVLALQVPVISATARHLLPELESSARQLAERRPSRIAVLTPPGLASLGQEACLKILEMTAGHVVSLPETYLGLRHGPMSFLNDETLVVCVLSSDQQRRLYELALIRELQEKSLGYLVSLGPADSADGLCHNLVPTLAPDIPDELRTPFEIVFLQLLGYHLSFVLGLDPDNPSPSGVITRVVRKFELHEND